MGKKGKATPLVVIVSLLTIMMAVGLLGLIFGFIEQPKLEVNVDGLQTGLQPSRAPSDQDTSFKFDVKNLANTTTSEGFDVTAYLFEKGDGGEQLVATITDTTSPTATSINYGSNYILKVVGTDGASGDTSYIQQIKGNIMANIVNGNLEFTATKANVNLEAKMNQHATLQCRLYDNVAKGLMYNTGVGETATDYETTGVTWTSTTDNATAYDETGGVDLEFECKAVQSDTDYNDRGVLVLIEAPVAVWDEPVVYVNGMELKEATAQLNDDERKAYTDYEYAFLIPQNVVMKDGSEGFKLHFAMDLLSGVASASADPKINFAVRTQYLATLGDAVKEGAVTDASSPSQIIALFENTLDVT